MDALATVDDVRKRLGRQTLSELDVDQITMLLEGASGVIAEAAGKGDDLVLDPVPSTLRFLSIDLVVRVMQNPEGLRSFQKQLGASQFSRSFDPERVGLELRPVERRLVRRVVHGRLSGSAVVSSTVEHYDDV